MGSSKIVSIAYAATAPGVTPETLLVGRQGFEPWTNGLKGRCSTAELPTRRKADAENIGMEGSCKQSFAGFLNIVGPQADDSTAEA
jgi:hypothetical protein